MINPQMKTRKTKTKNLFKKLSRTIKTRREFIKKKKKKKYLKDKWGKDNYFPKLQIIPFYATLHRRIGPNCNVLCNFYYIFCHLILM